MSSSQRELRHAKPPAKRSTSVYAGYSQHPTTHRSKTHVGLHMYPEHSIPGALPAQEVLSLRPGAALAGLLLVADRFDPRPRVRDAHGAHVVRRRLSPRCCSRPPRPGRWPTGSRVRASVATSPCWHAKTLCRWAVVMISSTWQAIVWKM